MFWWLKLPPTCKRLSGGHSLHSKVLFYSCRGWKSLCESQISTIRVKSGNKMEISNPCSVISHYISVDPGISRVIHCAWYQNNVRTDSSLVSTVWHIKWTGEIPTPQNKLLTDGWTDGQTNRQTDACMHACMHACIDEWMHACMHGKKDRSTERFGHVIHCSNSRLRYSLSTHFCA